MITLNRICIEVPDIKAIRIKCNKCWTILSFDPKTWRIGTSFSCPNCLATLGSPNHPDWVAIKSLVIAIHSLLFLEEAQEFSLHFEVDDKAARK